MSIIIWWHIIYVVWSNERYCIGNSFIRFSGIIKFMCYSTPVTDNNIQHMSMSRRRLKQTSACDYNIILYTENVLKSHFANASTRWYLGSSSYIYPVVPVLLTTTPTKKKYSCPSCMLLARAQKKIWMTHTKGWRVMARPSLSS